MLPINISIRILRPWNGTTHTLLPSRLVNPPVGGPIGRIDPFDMADPVGDAAKPRKTLPFDGVLEVAATRIVRAPQPHPPAGKQLRGVLPSLGVKLAFRHLIQ